MATPQVDASTGSFVGGALSQDSTALTIGSNSNRALYVYVAQGASGGSGDKTCDTSAITVTWNGVSLTALDTQNQHSPSFGNVGAARWFRLLAPDTGNHTLHIATALGDAPNTTLAWGAISLYDVNQTTPETVKSIANSDLTTSASGSTTITAGNLLLVGIATGTSMTNGTAVLTQATLANGNNLTAAGNAETQYATGTGSSQSYGITIDVNDCFVAQPLDINAVASSSPTLASSSSSTFTGVNTSDEVTGSITWSAGDLVVVVGVTEEINLTGLNTPTATGLSFTLVDSDETTSGCAVYVWKATAAAGGSGTVTSTHTAGNSAGAGITAYVYSNGAVGATAKMVKQDADTVSLTRAAANSAVVLAFGDWAALSNSDTVSPTTGGTIDQNVNAGSTLVSGHWTDQGAAGSTSYGLTGVSGTTRTTAIAVEIQYSAGVVPPANITFQQAGGNSAGGTTSLSIPYPVTGLAAGDLFLVGRTEKPNTATVTTPPGSFIALANTTGGTGSQAADTGPTRMTTEYLIASGSESGNLSTSQAGTPNSCVGQMVRFRKPNGTYWAVPIVATGDDSSHGTARSAAMGSSIDLQPGDMLVAFFASDTDTATAFTAAGFTGTGLTVDTVTIDQGAGGVTTGNDTGIYITHALVTAASGATTITATLTGGPSSCGPIHVVRLRAIYPVHYGRQTDPHPGRLQVPIRAKRRR